MIRLDVCMVCLFCGLHSSQQFIVGMGPSLHGYITSVLWPDCS